MTGQGTGDRIAGALVGLAAGDALGAGYEFGPPPSEIVPMKGGGPFGWEPGEWTDDTQMAICIAEEAATGSLDPVAVGERFLVWVREARDVGMQTRAVLDGASSGAGLRGRAAEHFARNPRGAAGNGSLMRTAPVALAHLGDAERIAEVAMEMSLLTHGDPLAGDACVLWCLAIDDAIGTGEIPDVAAGLERVDPGRRDSWAEAIIRAGVEPPGSFTPNGFVVTAFQAAWASIVQTPGDLAHPASHLEAALRTAVGIGNDTDTVAAIAGGLLGATHGASAVPPSWRQVLHGWPGYRAADLARLALMAAGRSAASGDLPEDLLSDGPA